MSFLFSIGVGSAGRDLGSFCFEMWFFPCSIKDIWLPFWIQILCQFYLILKVVSSTSGQALSQAVEVHVTTSFSISNHFLAQQQPKFLVRQTSTDIAHRRPFREQSVVALCPPIENQKEN